MTSIQGAITARENTKAAIDEASRILIQAVLDANQVDVGQVADIIFTVSDDLTAADPTRAACAVGLTEAGLLCVRAMPTGSPPLCLQLLMHVSQGKVQQQMRHVYLKGASVLRPDLACFAVAIDGPGGAGKSTVARMTASALGMIYIDTGAMYRAVALYTIRRGADVRDEAAVAGLLNDIDITLGHTETGQRLYVNGEDVTEALRTQAVAEASSVVAAYDAVRKKLTAIQRSLALSSRVIMDGRDIGAQVLPWAQVKIYLDASLDARTARRMHELAQKGEHPDAETVRHQIATRDERDMNRAISPLTRAADALYMDSSDMSPEEVVRRIMDMINIANTKDHVAESNIDSTINRAKEQGQ